MGILADTPGVARVVAAGAAGINLEDGYPAGDGEGELVRRARDKGVEAEPVLEALLAGEGRRRAKIGGVRSRAARRRRRP
jgi:hypothetical protein